MLIAMHQHAGAQMLGALGESGGTYQQDEEIGQIAAARFNAL